MKRTAKQIKKHMRARKKIRGTKNKPRLTVFRSNRYIYAQLIDDVSGKTLLGVAQEKNDTLQGKPIERAKQTGITLAKKAIEQKIKKVIFDKGINAYHGRIKAFAEGAREGGLQF